MRRLLQRAARERSGHPLRSHGGHHCFIALTEWIGEGGVLWRNATRSSTSTGTRRVSDLLKIVDFGIGIGIGIAQ